MLGKEQRELMLEAVGEKSLLHAWCTATGAVPPLCSWVPRSLPLGRADPSPPAHRESLSRAPGPSSSPCSLGPTPCSSLHLLTRGALIKDGKFGAVVEQARHAQPLLLSQRQHLAPVHHALSSAIPAAKGR